MLDTIEKIGITMIVIGWAITTYALDSRIRELKRDIQKLKGEN